MKTIRKILIANRGEIAVRIIRTCKSMNIKTVQVYSDADADSLAVQMADESVNIGPGPALQSYFNIEKIISAAKEFGVDAIHPGYGFLSEKADFVLACEAAGIVFIGPSAQALTDMGDKARAKLIAKRAGVPTSEGSDGELKDASQAIDIANAIGYPVIIKASAGGGGRGMKIFHNAQEIESNFDQLAAEAMRSFAKADLYIEKYFENIRHIEVQVVCDASGVFILGARDCTIQRKNQKLIEECPASILDSQTLESISRASVQICKAANYLNIGTIEYIYDLNSKRYYFLEMNTRIQVEHPVTEMCFGLDLVEIQIQIARQEKINLIPSSLTGEGYAIECRINAENPDKKFMPSPGTITSLKWPNIKGVRIDSHIFEGYSIPIFYDSLIAKIICHASTRQGAIDMMKSAISQLEIGGIKTTLSFHNSILNDNDFISNTHNTQFLKNW